VSKKIFKNFISVLKNEICFIKNDNIEAVYFFAFLKEFEAMKTL